jgi:hypothetical protein
MTMVTRHLPLFYGLFTAITLVSAATLLYRLLGFSRGDALYLACLTFGGAAYIISRRTLRKFGRK